MFIINCTNNVQKLQVLDKHEIIYLLKLCIKLQTFYY